jgi:hypothetical protein
LSYEIEIAPLQEAFCVLDYRAKEIQEQLLEIGEQLKEAERDKIFYSEGQTTISDLLEANPPSSEELVASTQSLIDALTHTASSLSHELRVIAAKKGWIKQKVAIIELKYTEDWPDEYYGR